MSNSAAVVVVTGANGLVGATVCRTLAERGAQVRAVVRRAGTAPVADGVHEHVGDAADVLSGAHALVTTVHPMGSSREVQHEVGVEGTARLARAARDAGVPLLVHVSTAGVHDRSPGMGDLAEDAALLPEGSGDYPDTKNAADAALAEVEGLTTVLVRPPAIAGAGPTSVWNTLRPQAFVDGDRSVNPAKSWAWVHVEDLAAFIADVAVGAVPTSPDPEQGPVPGAATPVLLAGEPATWGDYLGAVGQAVGAEPDWTDEPEWTGQLITDRARRWGWSPRVGLDQALAELREGLARR
ncbi:NAD(P)H-binding [Klenkia marina]|uniref:NAD(P)H-binding n=1 Tax=Klenkia marina TaxID=1960309 RepID=A0A1G4YNM1_9ACTN|nr:NAD(P)H-binding protein [Klenkia marina]SCX55096.1 NAD(P)H-binding [Klenkia marina]